MRRTGGPGEKTLEVRVQTKVTLLILSLPTVFSRGSVICYSSSATTGGNLN